MNKIVEKAYKFNKLQKEKGGWSGNENWDCGELPDVEVGDVCTIGDIWDGNGEKPEDSCSYAVTKSGENGETHVDIAINYTFEVVEEKEDLFETKIRITGIELV